jgi:uncharacterized protein (DUF488 family)
MLRKMMKELFTIGHSDHKMFDFLRLLRSHGITALVDVRSHPVSRFHPQFNKKILAADLKKAKIAYVFLGRELGARRVESSCYVDGRAEYDRIAALPIFQEGLRRIREGIRRYRVALMCAERDPLDCHRGILICRHLRDEGISIQHIREDGGLEPQGAFEKRLVDLLKIEPDLFDGEQAFDRLVEKAFDTQGRKIAYVQRRPGAKDPLY